MATYEQLQKEIKALQQQAELIKKEEKAKNVQKVKALMIELDVTPADMGFLAKLKNTRPKAEPKYRDPVSGKEWNGRGKPPTWIKNQNRDNFLIK